ncbi:hypothetical protein [Nocardioides sp. Iso805N]|uniref:hypothetical protein n=1 Tax=Nocardioides sp. Iso805N TaxID=1283287 RepID=UPI000372FC40|nr:hypothetical protein [Nocardioides sp. Iso805N]
MANDPNADGWKTIEYQHVRVDVPGSWRHADTSDCAFKLERWTPPGVGACSLNGGVFFYRSATYDPAHGPGIRHSDGVDDAVAWEGYVGAGDLVVYAADSDRATVRHLLRSVRAPGG